MIEDYFFVNTAQIPFERSSDERDLIESFCITEAGYLIFNLSVNYASTDDDTRTPTIRTRLRIDGTNMATSRVFDDEEPTNVSLFYEGEVSEDSRVEVTV